MWWTTQNDKQAGPFGQSLKKFQENAVFILQSKPQDTMAPQTS